VAGSFGVLSATFVEVIMVKAALIARLARLEAEKAHVEGSRWILNFAGIAAERVVDDVGRVWSRLPGEDYAAFEARATADRPYGFVCLEPV
jgi:hypothetical protein